MQYTIASSGDESNITVFIPGESMPLVAHSDHPNFNRIVAQVIAGESEGLTDLFDASLAASTRFEALSERVSVAHGRIYLDGDEVDNALTAQVVRFLNDGVEDWQPLVNFFEKVQANPTDHSREQLYDWLNAHDFTLTQSGDIVGYKGVKKQADGSLVSGWTGSAIVNGEPINGHIPNEVGSVVEMPRTSVAHDPGAACSYGLHVGTFDYARGYASGAMLEVHVNPRDVVSVPTDARGEKVRVCRYKVVNVIDAPHTSAVLFDDCDFDEDAFSSPDYDEDCGEGDLFV